MHQTAADWNSNFAECTTAQQELPYFEYAGPLDQSPTDQREHKLIRLPNSMVVVCTRDSDTTKAAAYLSVNVGSFADPLELHGMAHFLEHMLFMGSKKYPDTNEMDLYTGQNMGGTNALTSYENTTYELTVANSALEGGLDRFAQLFISPLFNPANVDQEINNIDSEFKGVLNKDGCRMLALKRLMVDPNHPYSKFNYGNISTLKESAQELGLNLRDEVVRFYEQHYSADIMKLAIVGNHPMDVLIEWAVSKFSAVKSKGNTRLPRMESPLTKDVMGNLVQYQCIGATSELYVQFATPDMQEHYQTYPCMYLQMLVKLNGPGSLMHYLKQKEWATSITVPAQEYSGFSETPIALKLTPKGLEYYQDVLQALFAYIHMLQEAGAQEWFFEELQSVASLSHKYYKKPQEKDWADLMSYGSHNPHIPPEHYLTKRRLLQKFDPEAITKLLNSLTPQNCQVFLGAQNQSGVKYDGKEKIFGTC